MQASKHDIIYIYIYIYIYDINGEEIDLHGQSCCTEYFSTASVLHAESVPIYTRSQSAMVYHGTPRAIDNGSSLCQFAYEVMLSVECTDSISNQLHGLRTGGSVSWWFGPVAADPLFSWIDTDTLHITTYWRIA